jgi:hypothetical protein
MAYLGRSLEDVWLATELTARRLRTDSAPRYAACNWWRRFGTVLVKVVILSYATPVRRQVDSSHTVN